MPQSLRKINSFTHFIGIDWSGAKGKRHKGIAIAICETGDSAPAIVEPSFGERYWSRKEITDWIKAGCGLPTEAKILIGIDAAFGMPFDDENAYFPGRKFPETVPELWQEIASCCVEEVDLFSGAFVEEYSEYFQQHGGRKGKCYSRRMRRTESICIETGAGPCESVFNLIGASQVGKSALSTMHMLHLLQECSDTAVWPFDEPNTARICLVEIYAALFAKLGGHKGKMRSSRELNIALQGLNSKAYQGELPKKIDDVTDALVTSAGLRDIANSKQYWQPAYLVPKIRKTEGWIFGIK
ncbi:hypothetical protein KFE96_08855 [Kordiimonas sp. SCSIO 12603]|uniref:hypothetical protein n=1 Tax=Kordiimonas sp. SCSIO 12603 TaxID=2829596 RepID=UPI0021073B92|nr:hypothetical protein [Kordiimonas sp. SCSIO 12603]UTW56978.1 hypothetical protein KFE96_08855 [Kordiimonas sp. SCSIO 12603]